MNSLLFFLCGSLDSQSRTARPARSNVHMTCCNCKTLAVKNRLLRTHCCSSSKIHFLYTLEDDYLQFLEQFFMHFYWFILLSSQFGSWTKRPADWSHRETPRWQNHGVFFLSSLYWFSVFSRFYFQQRQIQFCKPHSAQNIRDQLLCTAPDCV